MLLHCFDGGFDGFEFLLFPKAQAFFLAALVLHRRGGLTLDCLHRLLFLALPPLAVAHGFIGDRPIIGEDEQLITGKVEKGPVVTDDKHTSCKVLDVLFQVFHRRQVKVVCRFIEQQEIWIGQQSRNQVQPSFLAPRQAVDALAVHGGREPEEFKKFGGAYHLAWPEDYLFGDVLDIFEDELVADQLPAALVVVGENRIP